MISTVNLRRAVNGFSNHPNFRQKCYWTVNRIEKGDVSAVVLVIVTASDILTPISISRLDSLNVCGDVKVWIAKIASEVTSLVER